MADAEARVQLGRSTGRKSRRRERGQDSQERDPEALARNICLRRLASAPRTRAELADTMRGREVPEEVIERVLDRFGEVGLIDDTAFAQAWVDSRHHGRGLARRALADELKRKGVNVETVEEAVHALEPAQEEATARALIRKRLRSTRNLDPQVRFRRLAGMLARKGYPGGLVFRLIREELEAEGADTTDLPEEPF